MYPYEKTLVTTMSSLLLFTIVNSQLTYAATYTSLQEAKRHIQMPHLMSIQMMARLPILMANSDVVLMITINHKVMHMAKLVPIKAKEQAKHQEAHLNLH